MKAARSDADAESPLPEPATTAFSPSVAHCAPGTLKNMMHAQELSLQDVASR